MLPRAVPNTKKALQTIAQDFVVFLSCLEFMPTHPRAFSEAGALWIAVKVGCCGANELAFQHFDQFDLIL